MNRALELVKQWAKLAVAAATATAYTVQAALSDGEITGAERNAIIVAYLMALLVGTVPNKGTKGWPAAKARVIHDGGWSELVLILFGAVVAIVALILFGRLT